MKPRVVVINGDIRYLKVDALITAINSGGVWAGGIDGVIARTAGAQYHKQAAAALPLEHGQTVHAKRQCQHAGEFRDVIFVIDDLQGPLRDIVYAGLEAANKAGLRHVSLPTIRMGVMLGQVEDGPKEAVLQMALGVWGFLGTYPDTTLETITFVVYDNPTVRRLLTDSLAAALIH